MIAIRPERPDDYAAIRTVERDAFGRKDEADLVDKLRAAAAVTLSLVAEMDGHIVGHILFSPMTLNDKPAPVVALGPVAVTPAHQNTGIGGALIRAGLARCREMGYELCVLLGHSSYYPRFGFVSAGAHDLTNNLNVSGDPFMVFELVDGALAQTQGEVAFHQAFDDT
ncbi:MAG: N-acetyltransferase [Anaerolineae bacterium]|nr:N-acetyltransferase [Anaerolineae bacterium]MCO5194664.1 N-acetyltransferase [Anaerolineae bacterium]